MSLFSSPFCLSLLGVQYMPISSSRRDESKNNSGKKEKKIQETKKRNQGTSDAGKENGSNTVRE